MLEKPKNGVSFSSDFGLSLL